MSTTPQSPRDKKHFTMIRALHLADLFTLSNAACGIASIFLAMAFVESGGIWRFLAATAMAPLALVFDIFDGQVARWRRRHSAMGRELDSLADIVSFGAAPAAMAFAAGMRGGWDVAILIYFVCCGVSRLARFNVTAETLSAGADKVAYFEGTPIPTSVVLCAVMAACAWAGRLGDALPGNVWQLGPWALHPIVLLFAISGSLMISKTLRVPKP